MPPRIKFTKNDNTDRDFPNALEIIDAEFKVNGEYICVEPCGGGSGQHLLGDVHIYVETWGDDSFPDEDEPIRTGTQEDPFATIQRAIDYIIEIVTIDGMIYVHLGDGTFYISKTIHISHPNRIEFIGLYKSSDELDGLIEEITLIDNTICNMYYQWYGDKAIFGSGINTSNIYYVSISSGVNTSLFGDSDFNVTHGGCSNGIRGILYGNAIYTISYITFAILSDEAEFGNVTNVSYTRTCSDGNTSINFGGGSVAQTLIEKVIITIESNATYFGDLLYTRYDGGSCNNSVTGIIGGGRITSNKTVTDIIEEVKIAIDSNSTSFGFLSTQRVWATGTSDRTYGLIYGGGLSSLYLSSIEKTNITSGSWGSLFGNLSIGKNSVSACSDSTTGIFTGGSVSTNVYTSLIEQVVIAIEADSTNFGDFYNLHGNKADVGYVEGCSGN